MKVKILIVEDEILVAEDTASDLEKDGFEITDIAISSQEVMQSIKQNPPHLVLMDINIKGELDGIETAELINKKFSTPIIYVTSNTSQDFVSRAIQTGPHAFISKPYNYSDLVIAIELALKNYNTSVFESHNQLKYDSVFVKNGDFYKKVLIDDILYVEADGSYCKVFTKAQKYTFSFNLNHFQSHINNTKLQRVHRSFVVNINNVDGFDSKSLLIQDKIIPVSHSYKDEITQYFQKL